MAPKPDDNTMEACPRVASSGSDLPSAALATFEIRFEFGAGKRRRIQDPSTIPPLATARFGREAGLMLGATTTFHQSNRRSKGLPARHASASAAEGEGRFGNLSSYASMAL